MSLFKKYLVPSVAALSITMPVMVLADKKDSLFDLDPVSGQMHQMHPLASGIIVKYKKQYRAVSEDGAIERAAQLGEKYQAPIAFKRMMSGDAEVYNVDIRQMESVRGGISLEQLVNKIASQPDVEYAEIDAWVIPYRVPNDPRYADQWHYDNPVGGMNLENAWDITTGSGAVTVAVLDTGYRPHVDLVGNIVGGYDMISNTSVSNDGNGRDSDAQDPGDWTTAGQCAPGSDPSDSSWHGTHVAGTVAAVSDNNTGVTGVAWNVNVLPVRVLGTCGGSVSDIADGIRWAAGLNVNGVPNNTNPADVINMSLGSRLASACSNTYQNAINAAVAQGVTVVAAAGNSNTTANHPPANCNNVISVAATSLDGSRAFYSNFGASVDVAAPGGDFCNPTTDAAPTTVGDCEGGVLKNDEMVLSTYNSGTQGPGADNYAWNQGTSMASPHVAGAAALLYSVQPDITPAEVEAALTSTARAFPNVNDHQCTTTNCGAGIVDVEAALQSLGGPGGPVELQNGVAVTNLGDSQGDVQYFTLQVPAGATNLSFQMSGGVGDADLYVRFGSEPTTSVYDCRPFLGGSNETCNINNVQAGTYHVMLRAYSDYASVSLIGSYTTGGGSQSFFENTADFNIPDNNPAGVTSPINVSRSGNAGNIDVSYNIVHTWRGDLRVSLIAPDQTEFVLRERSGGGADDLNETVSVAAGSIPASGIWRLKVVDAANQDVGYIDSWSMQF